MKDYRIGGRYARALFALAEERGELDKIEEEFKEVVQLAKRHPEISRLVLNSTLSREEKEDFLEKILPREFSTLLKNFLKVLIRKKRFQDLPLIQEKFHRLYEEKKGLQRVRVLTPIPLNEILQEKLRQVLGKKLKREIYLEMAQDPEILGGFVLDFDGTQMDASFRSRLQELKQKLLEPLC